jgi:hypothetical protein
MTELPPGSVGAGYRRRERGRGDADRQDGRRGGTPKQNSPVVHETLHFDLVMESAAICEFARPGELTSNPVI